MNKNETRTGNLYVILAAILVAVAVVAAIAGAITRSREIAEMNIADETTAREETRKPETTKKEAEDVFSPTKETEKETEIETEALTEAPAESEKTDVLPQFINPTGGGLIKDYSMDVPVFSVTMEDYRTHNGVDIFVSPGERVMAAADGEITEIYEEPMMGVCVEVAHSGGAVTVYKNLSPDIPDGVEKGMKVSAGTLIGVSGDSALEEISEESHVHFEIKVNGENVDPCDYIDFTKAEEVYEG